MEPDQGRSQITHIYPTMKQQHQAPTPGMQTQKRRPERPARVGPRKGTC